jgi:hypothetical protein
MIHIMQIPKHIKVLSIIFFLNAAVSFLIGAVSLVPLLYGLIIGQGNPINTSDTMAQNLPLLGLNILLSLVSILTLILLGTSLRKLKPWARKITLVYSLLAIIFFLINLFTGDGNFSLGVFVQMYAIWVLLQPDVKEAFGVNIERLA